MSFGTGNDKLKDLCSDLLLEIGENPSREGLVKTPQRFAKALRELTSGYHQDIDQVVNGAIYSSTNSEMVLVKDIEFYSLCEHHLLPFFGKASVAYIPKGKIIGLSKIPRIVQHFTRRLQVQENLTEQITETIERLLKPYGVACMIEAYHMCMMMRGIQVQSSKMVTNSMRGTFLSNPASRQEFMMLVKS